MLALADNLSEEMQDSQDCTVGVARKLPEPNLVKTSWKDGQVFSLQDDPDRTNQPFDLPLFVHNKDPLSQKIEVEHLNLPWFGHNTRCHAVMVHNVLTHAECVALIDCINAKGFTPALLNVGGGRQQLFQGVRDGWRCIFDSEQFASYLLSVLQPHLPEEWDGRTLSDINERCRVLCYTPQQQFSAHYDGTYCRSPPHPRAGDKSRITIQLYLNTIPEEYGGATTLLDGRSARRKCCFLRSAQRGNPIACQPRAGSCLLFSQNIYHEGSELLDGYKYTLRTEAMYSDNPHPTVC